jgi:hypothetical protein
MSQADSHSVALETPAAPFVAPVWQSDTLNQSLNASILSHTSHVATSQPTVTVTPPAPVPQNIPIQPTATPSAVMPQVIFVQAPPGWSQQWSGNPMVMQYPGAMPAGLSPMLQAAPEAHALTMSTLAASSAPQQSSANTVSQNAAVPAPEAQPSSKVTEQPIVQAPPVAVVSKSTSPLRMRTSTADTQTVAEPPAPVKALGPLWYTDVEEAVVRTAGLALADQQQTFAENLLERDRQFNARVANVQQLAQDYFAKHEWEMSKAMREQFFQDLISSVATLKQQHVATLANDLDATKVC